MGRFAAVGALALGVICISLSAVLVLLANVGAPASAFYRLGFAAVVLVPVWFVRKRVRVRRSVWPLLLTGGACFAVDILCFNAAVPMTSAATATLLGNNAPLAVGLGAALFFRERQPLAFWFGLIVAVAGSIVIVGGDALRAAGNVTGDAIAVAAALAFGGYLLVTQRLRLELDTFSLTTLSIATSTLILYAFAASVHAPLWGFTPHAWLALAALGVFSQLIGYLAISYALGHLPASVVSATLLLQGPLTALVAFIVLGQAVSRATLAGGLLVLAGVLTVNLARTRGHRRQPSRKRSFPG